MNQTPIPEGEGEHGVFTEMEQENLHKLHQILTRKHPPKTWTLLSNQLDAQRWFESYQTFYQSCLNETQLTQLGHRPILKLADLIRSPLTGDRVDRHQLASLLADLHTQTNFDSLMTLTVDGENARHDLPAVEIKPFTWTLLSLENYYDSHILAVYKRTIQNTLKRIHGKHPPSFASWFQRRLYPRMTPTTHTNWTRLAEAIVTLELNLVAISIDTEGLDSSTFTVEELNAQYPFINWTYLFQLIEAKLGLRHPIREVLLPQPTYFAKLNQLIPTVSPEVLNFYVWWHLIRLHASYLDAPSSRLMQEYKVALGLTPFVDRELRCIQSSQGPLLAHWFTAEVLRARDVQQIESMVSSIVNEFRKCVDQSSWFDVFSRMEAKSKLKRMKLFLGAPKRYHNIKSFQHDLGQLTFNASRYFENQMQANKVNIQETWSKLNVDEESFEPDWKIAPLEVNAYFDIVMNEMVLFFFYFS
jgi:predicted metalloendopeptidase